MWIFRFVFLVGFVLFVGLFVFSIDILEWAVRHKPEWLSNSAVEIAGMLSGIAVVLGMFFCGIYVVVPYEDGTRP